MHYLSIMLFLGLLFTGCDKQFPPVIVYKCAQSFTLLDGTTIDATYKVSNPDVATDVTQNDHTFVECSPVSPLSSPGNQCNKTIAMFTMIYLDTNGTTNTLAFDKAKCTTSSEKRTF